ncbi:HAD family hydrolase [Methanolobus halotolerans]|uniref:HAD family hydrolase n=1 Tax=Methanolobus halotolerans TaxID=2052935 RepID=A0A4E0Q0Y8_9EURY|nr:HAD family hydrolase [Methanolobus halotolerans]TGC10632.1 HAD family hydrolase [Methanolobus halotolerans]
MSGNNQIKGLIFDCYGTLIDIKTDENSPYTYDAVSKWLQYHGVKIGPDTLKENYFRKVKAKMAQSDEKCPEIKIEEIFADICSENSIWDINTIELGIETSKVFRSASLRKLEIFQESVAVLVKHFYMPKCIVSNGQRVFSEQELRFLGLYDHFDFIVFSSDLGYKKPDHRLFKYAMERLGLEPHQLLSLGDTLENDIIPPQELGMRSMHIKEAWEFMS